MCNIVGDKIGCHESCKTCLTNSICGLDNVCTSCHPNQYKISPKFSDKIFKCSQKCDGELLQHDDYYFCDGDIQHLSMNGVSRTQSNSVESNYEFVFIIISVIIGFIFLLFLIKIIYKLKYKNKKMTPTANIELNMGDVEMQPMTSINVPKLEPLILKKLPMITNVEDFKKLEEIGGGNYSIVYKGTFHDKSVAIKVARDEGRRSIHKELKIYDKISHSNILPALGVHLGVDNMLFLSLRKYNLTNYFIDYGNELNFPQLKQYCIQVADAMKYLHNKNILHCDLKIDNILMKDDKGDQIEISDFGCAIDLEHDHCNKFVGTQTHTAYELLKHILNPVVYHGQASKASDVWSFAVTSWQIFQKAADIPKNFITKMDIIKNYEAGKKLPIPVPVTEDFWRYIFLPCFDLHPTARPTMEDLHKSLLKFREAE